MTDWATMIVGRLAQTALVAWTIVTMCFVFVHALPGDTALRIAEAVRRNKGARPVAFQMV